MSTTKSIPEHVEAVKVAVSAIQGSIKDESPESITRIKEYTNRLADEINELSKFPSNELAQFPDAIIGLSASLSSLVDNLHKAKGETKNKITKILHQMKAQKGYNK